jgi:hypothetical protein
VTATISEANYQGSANATLEIAKINQTVSIIPIADRAFSSTKFNVTATATSGLTAITYTAAGSCTIATKTVTLTGVGTCSITATQAGNTNYNAASSTLTFTITQGSQTITFAALANRPLSGTPFTITATSTSGLPVSFSASGPCTVAGNQVTMTGRGLCSITATQAGDANYTAASRTRTFTIQ